uniref:Patched domain containing 3 n=1 Tax=Sinocyclocheilus anshuiensis TaxID=1608454 RepID=A0A671KZV3_9TELE
MAFYRTDCVEKPVSKLFEKLGHLVALGGGLYFLKDRENNDVEKQFTPINGPSKEGVIQKASAIRLFYFLQDNNGTSEWLQQFQNVLSKKKKHNFLSLQVSHFTSLSRQEEIEKYTTDGIPLFSITYSLAISFSVLSCMRDPENKIWVSFMGVLSAGLAVLSSFGLLLLFRVPFVITVANSPFLILGIGVDDMFIMLSNWQQTKVKNPVEKRMAETFKEAAMFITITTLTDVLGFYIGLLSEFRSVQAFCLYTSTSIIFCYIYNILFFGSVLALNDRREQSDRHWLTCCKLPRLLKEKTGAEKQQPIAHFFKFYYGPFLTKPWTKVCVMLLYLGYLAGGIYGCFIFCSRNVCFTTAVMLVISLLLIPNPNCSLWVTFSIGSGVTGITGFMALWGVNLDSILMIILVVCIGFTVDFSAHISYAFVSSKKSTTNEQAVDALFSLGYPVLQGAASTIIGVLILAASKNHIFRTFFKIMFLIMIFGLAHSIIFMKCPVCGTYSFI